MNLPDINSSDELEKSWAKWLKEQKQLYRQGVLQGENRNQFISLAREFNIELREPTEIFNHQCNNFRNFMKTRETR